MQVFAQHVHYAEALLGPELRRLLDAGERDSSVGGCWSGSFNLKADHGQAGSRR
jgi:hypothetical protein